MAEFCKAKYTIFFAKVKVAKMNAELYVITADYRPNNPNKPKYYVVASSKKEAREKFSRLISWLKIYGVEVVDPSKSIHIINHPEKHIIIK